VRECRIARVVREVESCPEAARLARSWAPAGGLANDTPCRRELVTGGLPERGPGDTVQRFEPFDLPDPAFPSTPRLPAFVRSTRSVFLSGLLKTKRPARTQPFIPGSQGRLRTRWHSPFASWGHPQPPLILQPLERGRQAAPQRRIRRHLEGHAPRQSCSHSFPRRSASASAGPMIRERGMRVTGWRAWMRRHLTAPRRARTRPVGISGSRPGSARLRHTGRACSLDSSNKARVALRCPPREHTSR
jgi:hypothetical protein